MSAGFPNRLDAGEIIAACQHRTRRSLDRAVEREHPARAMWRQRDPLLDFLCIGRLKWYSAAALYVERGRWRFRPRRVRSSPFHAVASRHDQPAPIHRTSRRSAASRKLRAESDFGRICKSCNASRRKLIGKADVCRTEGTQFKPEPSIDSGKQEKEEYHKRRSLKEEFARRADRRPDRARRRPTMKLN